MYLNEGGARREQGRRLSYLQARNNRGNVFCFRVASQPSFLSAIGELTASIYAITAYYKR